MNKKSASQTKAQEVFQILPVQKQKHIKDNEPDVYKTIFSDDILLDANILNDFILDKIIGGQNLIFMDCRFEGLSKLELEVNGELNFYQCSFYKNSEINFDDINGKFSLYKTNFSDKCYLEYELLENKEYEPLVFENDLKIFKKNFNKFNKVVNENFEKISKDKKENLTKEIEVLNRKIEKILKEFN